MKEREAEKEQRKTKNDRIASCTDWITIYHFRQIHTVHNTKQHQRTTDMTWPIQFDVYCELAVNYKNGRLWRPNVCDDGVLEQTHTNTQMLYRRHQKGLLQVQQKRNALLRSLELTYALFKVDIFSVLLWWSLDISFDNGFVSVMDWSYTITGWSNSNVFEYWLEIFQCNRVGFFILILWVTHVVVVIDGRWVFRRWSSQLD